MASNAPMRDGTARPADVITNLVSVDGSIAHRYVSSSDLLSGRFAARNLADSAHYLCTLHGRHPGVIDLAATRIVHDAARDWMLSAVDGFAAERLILTQLAVAAGPLPSTPGQPESEAAVVGQRHALDMLARSDRDGCALGAAAALVLDWSGMRSVLDVSAKKWGVTIATSSLPSTVETRAMIESVAVTPAVERAMGFGAQQILNQHRGLWDLLEARHIARGDY